MCGVRSKYFINLLLVALTIILGAGQPHIVLGQGTPVADLPPATIINDEGGPTIVTGTAGSANFAFMPNLWPNPTVVLIDVTNLLSGHPENFVPKAGQILGLLTEPLFPGPGKVRIN